MKIAIAGTRGIPAAYGGFETFAEELSTRLAARGHHVTVYCRARHSSPSYRGVHLVYMPTIRRKYLDTVVHGVLSTLHLLLRPPGAVLYCNAAIAFCTWLPRLARVGVALNVDGLERNRKKWNLAGRLWYRLGEWLSTFCPDAVVTDALRIQEYYAQQYGKQTVFIPYGAETGKLASQQALAQLGLEAGRYFLYVSRMEPENNALLVRQGFEKLDTDLRLALIGDAPYSADYIRDVRATRDPRIVIPGAIYGQGYHELTSHCFAYIHATEVGGTHPALIEAMGRGSLTLYLQTPENEEVAGGAGIPFTEETFQDVMRRVLHMEETERNLWRARAAERVRSLYSWDAVTDAYEKLLEDLAR
jgi:glycosyltransferase involved in cell wall biosynthesis